MVICDVMRFALFASIPLVVNLIWLVVALQMSNQMEATVSEIPSRTVRF